MSPTTTEAQAPGNPLAGVRLYVDHHSPSWHQWRVYRHSRQRRKARLIRKIAREPRALWFGRFTRPHFRKKVRRVIVRPGYAQRCQGRKIAWYAPRALAYARHATRWESPPRGTRFGYRRRYPFSAFAGSR